MSTVTVVLTVDPTTALPAGSNAYSSTLITLTDAAGDVQTATVNGTETPAWTAEFDDVTATGGGTVVAQPQDASGTAIGASESTSLPTAAGGGGGTTAATYPAVTGISVTLA